MHCFSIEQQVFGSCKNIGGMYKRELSLSLLIINKCRDPHTASTFTSTITQEFINRISLQWYFHVI